MLDDLSDVAATRSTFEAPTSPAGFGLEVRGSELLVEAGAEFPEVCVRCGAEDGVALMLIEGKWGHPLSCLTIVLLPLYFGLMSLGFYRRYSLMVGLCPVHRKRWQRLDFLAKSVILLGVLVMMACLFTLESDAFMVASVFGGFVVTMVGVVLVVWAKPFRVTVMNSGRLSIRGVPRDVLRRLVVP